MRVGDGASQHGVANHSDKLQNVGVSVIWLVFHSAVECSDYDENTE
jgi:hypothetical protein